MTSDNHWRFSAACFGQHYLFDSVEDYNGRNIYPYEREAKEICATCPVFDQCREWADKEKEPQGIWAGEIYPRKKQR